MEGQGYKGALRTPSSGSQALDRQGAQNSGAPAKIRRSNGPQDASRNSCPSGWKTAKKSPESEISGRKS
jgi:hypothetical protein